MNQEDYLHAVLELQLLAIPTFASFASELPHENLDEEYHKIE